MNYNDRFLRGRVISEFSLNHPIAGERVSVKLPVFSQILRADATSNGEILITAMHHKDAYHVKNHYFHLFATGWDIDCEAECQIKYINTVHIDNEWGTTPWHVFVEE